MYSNRSNCFCLTNVKKTCIELAYFFPFFTSLRFRDFVQSSIWRKESSQGKCFLSSIRVFLAALTSHEEYKVDIEIIKTSEEVH